MEVSTHASPPLSKERNNAPFTLRRAHTYFDTAALRVAGWRGRERHITFRRTIILRQYPMPDPGIKSKSSRGRREGAKRGGKKNLIGGVGVPGGG